MADKGHPEATSSMNNGAQVVTTGGGGFIAGSLTKRFDDQEAMRIRSSRFGRSAATHIRRFHRGAAIVCGFRSRIHPNILQSYKLTFFGRINS